MNVLSNVKSSYPESFPELFAEYEAYRLRVQCCMVSTFAYNLQYAKHFVKLTGAATPRELFNMLNFKVVSNIVSEYGKTHSHGARVNFHACARVFLKFCVDKEYVSRDLSPTVPTIRQWRLSILPKGIPPESIQALYRSIDDSIMPGMRDMAIMRLLATYGVRGVHVRSLELKDIEWNADTLTFPAVKRGNAIRQHLTAEVGNALLLYIRYGRPSNGHSKVFLTTSPPFGPLERSSDLTCIIRQCLKTAGISLPEGVSPGSHCFRHAFASRLVGKVPMKNISDMLGHKSLSSTLVYSKVDLEALRETAQVWPEVDHE